MRVYGSTEENEGATAEEIYAWAVEELKPPFIGYTQYPEIERVIRQLQEMAERLMTIDRVIDEVSILQDTFTISFIGDMRVTFTPREKEE